MLKLKPVWGIDIGDSALKAVKLKTVGKQIVLQDFQIIRYADVAGSPSARREEALPQALAALQAAGLGREPCYVSIAPQSVFSRFISLPPVDKRRVPEIVLYEARQQIPFDLSEVIWADQPVRKEFIPGEEIEIGLFAVKRDVVASYLAELNAISGLLHGIQVAPLALYNFIRYDVPLDQPTVIMDMGAQSTDLLIVDGPRFWLRNLPIAGNTFTAMLEKRLKIPKAEAEKLKYAVGESRHRRKLLEVLRPVMRDLVGEIQRSIGYYKSLSQDVKFEEILVTGDGYKLFGLDRFLAEQLQYRVTPVNQLRNITVQGSPELSGEIGNALPSLGVAMGLALQGLDHGSVTIDLLPDDFVIHRELHKKRFSGLIAAGLLWAVMGCFFLKENHSLASMAKIESSGEQTLKNVETRK
ncbi:MAG: pilus assembly protein PilM, partial [Alphaproteobacteria bacterium]